MAEKCVAVMRKFFNGLGMAAGFLMGFATLLAALNAISRYVFSRNFSWSEEFCTYACVMVVFLVLPWLETEDNGQLSIDIFSSVVKNKTVLKVVYILRGILTLVIFALIMQSAWVTIRSTYAAGAVTYLLKIPRYLIYSVVMACYGLASLGWLGILLLHKGRSF